MTTNPELVALWRGEPATGAVESRHRGALAIADAHGRLHTALGDVGRPVFPRSAVKLLQALPLVAGGGADALGLTDAELALCCASHGGEAAHVAGAAAMLARVGLDDAALECGAHPPYEPQALAALHRSGEAPRALHNNCSGKHAGFVCLACTQAGRRGDAARDAVRGYVRRGHAVMDAVDAAVSTATGVRLDDAPWAIDGCGIPTYGLPLAAIATGFARVATGQGLPTELAAAAARLRAAIAAHPHAVAGTGRFDTQVMQRLGARVCCKVGAEGVYAAALPELGLGVALKIDDGTGPRAAEVAMAAVIETLLPLDAADTNFMRGFSDAVQTNWSGQPVARLRALPALRDALAGRPRGAG